MCMSYVFTYSMYVCIRCAMQAHHKYLVTIAWRQTSVWHLYGSIIWFRAGKHFAQLKYIHTYIRTYIHRMRLWWLVRAVVDHERMASVITARGVRWTGLPHSPKTNGDHLIKDNLACYCPKTFETAKGKKERWHHRESNPGPLAKAASALPLSYNTHWQPPLSLPLLLLCSWLTINVLAIMWYLQQFVRNTDIFTFQCIAEQLDMPRKENWKHKLNLEEAWVARKFTFA